MSLRAVPLIAVFALLSCAGESMKVRKGEPQTAREKMLAEQKKNPPEKDEAPPASRSWNKWRYKGNRAECFYAVGGRCFKTQKSACQAARCKAPAKCKGEGAGPTTIACTKK